MSVCDSTVKGTEQEQKFIKDFVLSLCSVRVTQHLGECCYLNFYMNSVHSIMMIYLGCDYIIVKFCF